ncbi:MAG: glutamine synthetase III, partial [Chitinophagales bacterium]
MISNRSSAMEQVLNREAIEVKVPSTKISDYYGSNVFSEEIMRKHLSEEAYFSVKASIQQGQKIDRKIA